MESKDFRIERSSGIITVHSMKALRALDYAVTAAEDMYESLTKETTINEDASFITIKTVTDTTFRVEVSVQVDPSDEELAKCYETTF